MTLEQHIIDTIGEWQVKMGSFDNTIRLYYPKESLCSYLGLEATISEEVLEKEVRTYLSERAPFLGSISTETEKSRVAILIERAGCNYVSEHFDTSELLMSLLEAIKTQKMELVERCFEEYALTHGTKLCKEAEDDGLGTVFYMEDETVEPYRYCVENDVFGITYHRFAREDFEKL